MADPPMPRPRPSSQHDRPGEGTPIVLVPTPRHKHLGNPQSGPPYCLSLSLKTIARRRGWSCCWQLRLVDAYPAVRFFAIAAGAKLELLGKLVLKTANVGVGWRQVDRVRGVQGLLNCCSANRRSSTSLVGMTGVEIEDASKALVDLRLSIAPQNEYRDLLLLSQAQGARSLAVVTLERQGRRRRCQGLRLPMPARPSALPHPPSACDLRQKEKWKLGSRVGPFSRASSDQ